MCEREFDSSVIEKALVATFGFATFSYLLGQVGFSDGFKVTPGNVIKSFVPALLTELLSVGYSKYIRH